MSLSLEFEPHSWYRNFAIKKDEDFNDPCEFNYETDGKYCRIHDRKINPYDNYCEDYAPKWSAFTDDGNTYRIISIYAETLKELKNKIIDYNERESERMRQRYANTAS